MTGDHPKPKGDLHNAIRSGNNIALSSLIVEGRDVNEPDSAGVSPLNEAILCNNLQAVDLLLKNGADPSLPDSGGYAPIYHSARNGRIAITALLLRAGAAPISAARESLHVLMGAAAQLTVALRERIASNPAVREALEMTDDFGVTPLMLMVERDSLLAVEQMLDMGADISAADRNLNTVLHRAARGYNREMAALLLERGADPYAVNIDGKTPLDLALEPWANAQVREVFSSLTQDDPPNEPANLP